MRRNDFYFLWGMLLVSPLGYLYYGIRIVISIIFVILLILWDLLCTIFAIIASILNNLMFILIVAAIFGVFLAIHLEWSHFVVFLNKVFLPFIQFAVDEVIRRSWNEVFLVVINIAIYVWNAFVQLIGFVVYFIVTMVITISEIVIQVLGQINIGQFLEDILEIVFALVRMALQILQTFIQVGALLIVQLIPFVIGLLKLWMQLIMVIFKIYEWLFITLFRVLLPILNLVVEVVDWFTSMFAAGSAGSMMAAAAMRALLTVDTVARGTTGPSNWGTAERNSGFFNGTGSRNDQAANVAIMSLFKSATRFYDKRQYQNMMQSLEVIHNSIRGLDAHHANAGYFSDTGERVPGYERHLYDEADIAYLYGRRVNTDPDKLPEQYDAELIEYEQHQEVFEYEDEGGANFGKAAEEMLREGLERQQQQQQRGRSLLEQPQPPATVDEYHNKMADIERLRKEYMDSLKAAEKRDVGFKPTPEPESSGGSSRRVRARRVLVANATRVRRSGPPRNNATKEELYAKVPKEHHWRIDHSADMQAHEVYPELRGKKLRISRPEPLMREETPEGTHERRRRAVAYTHALWEGVHMVYKRGVRTGRLHRAVHSAFKQLTGHDDMTALSHSMKKQYVSVDHFMYENTPHIVKYFPFNWMAAAAPDYEHYFPIWVEKQAGVGPGGKLERHHWEDLERRNRWRYEHGLDPDNARTENDGGTDHHLGNMHIKKRSGSGFSDPKQRQLLALNINLELLYERDCFHEPHNILCLPTVPLTWVIPFVNFSTVIFVSNLAENPLCSPPFYQTNCIFCWDAFLNFLVELRFLLYVIDLIWLVSPFGIILRITGIVPERPTEYICQLGNAFPPLKWLVDILLLFGCGFPDGQQWACFFEYFFYLVEGFVVLLIIYYIIDPLWEWLLRSGRAIWAVYIAYTLRLVAYRQYVEVWDEMMLGRVSHFYSSGGAWARNKAKLPISSELGASSAAAAGIAPAPSAATNLTNSRIANNHTDRVLDIMAAERRNEAMKRQIAQQLDRLSERMGTGAVRLDQPETARGRRAGNTVWSFVTDLMQIPHTLTPAYNLHVRNYHDHMRDLSQPPGASNFPSPHETFTHDAGSTPESRSRTQQ